MNYMEKGLKTLCLFFSLFLLSCSSKEQTAIDKTITVKVDTVKPRSNELELSYPGKIKSSEDIDIAFQVSGTIQKVLVNAGSKVNKGDLLAYLDPTDYTYQLSATEAEYNGIKGNAERIITLYEKGSVSKSDYEKAVYGLEQITATLNAHKKALADTRIYAPFNGYIQKKHFNSNETVAAGFPVVSLFNQNALEVEIHIPATDYLRRNEFKDFYCTIDRDPKIKYPLKLISINQKANLNQLYTVRLACIPQPQATLPTPGMTATINIKRSTESSIDSQLTLIPLSSIKETDGNCTVWVYNPEKEQINTREVKILQIKRNGTVIISEGLNPGEIVVSAGVNYLKENQQVKVIKPISDTNKGGLL